MNKTPITYLGLCEKLLNEGVDAQAIIKHRFVLQAIGAGAYSEPTDIDYDRQSFSFRLTNGTHAQYFRFSRLCTSAQVWREATVHEANFRSSLPSRVALTNAGSLMIELYPLDGGYAWYERLRIWIETKTLQVMAWFAKRDA